MRGHLIQIAIIIIFKVSSVYSSITYLKNSKNDFKNTDCLRTSSCDLKKFKIEFYDYKIRLNQNESNSYGTYMKASYETRHINDLEKYGVVNFIQGCHFISFLKNGSVQKKIIRKRKFFNKTVDFFHPFLVIDSIDIDPLYNSHKKYLPNRHYLYQFIDNSDNSINYYGIKQPHIPVLFITDKPGTAFYDQSSGIANNISLVFKTCVFKTTDIPEKSEPNKLFPEQAIHCFDWKSSFVFDHNKNKFNTLEVLNPFCTVGNHLGANKKFLQRQ